MVFFTLIVLGGGKKHSSIPLRSILPPILNTNKNIEKRAFSINIWRICGLVTIVGEGVNVCITSGRGSLGGL